jgi:hypothetical protein
MDEKKLLSCINEISNHLGSGIFQLIDEDEMLECGAIENTQEELQEAVDNMSEFIVPLIQFVKSLEV